MAALAPCFMPLQVIEARADALLEKARSEKHWNGKLPVPIDEIAEILLGLTVELGDLLEEFGDCATYGDGPLLGAIRFDEREIWIDQSLDPEEHPRKRGRYRFTLAHEVAHWVLHLARYGVRSGRGALASEAPIASVGCRGLDGAAVSGSRRPRIEIQADLFAGAVMMPRRVVTQLWADAASAGRLAKFDLELAGESQMSISAARIRMEELGLRPSAGSKQGDLFHAA